MSAVPNSITGFPGDVTGAGAFLAGAGSAPDADPSAVVARLNALLRGEISAAETYRNVLEKMAPGEHASTASALREMQAEHGRSCQLLRDRITTLGGMPSDSSGVWGVWAQTVQGALSLFGGEAGGLRALREGEDHGIKDYEIALNEVDALTAQLIQDRLLPSQQRHLATLDELLVPAAGNR